jgi:hypothetical protein
MENTKVYGIGIYKKGKFSSKDKSYKTWKNILQRCYDSKLHLKYPTYKGCKICDEWVYFQSFAQWHFEHYATGLQIDKDILGNGKIYSPETCCFVPNKINNLFQKNEKRQNGFPIGVTKVGKRFRARFNIDTKHKKHIGYFGSFEAAFSAVRQEKINYSKKIMSELNISSPIQSAILNKL